MMDMIIFFLLMIPVVIIIALCVALIRSGKVFFALAVAYNAYIYYVQPDFKELGGEAMLIMAVMLVIFCVYCLLNKDGEIYTSVFQVYEDISSSLGRDIFNRHTVKYTGMMDEVYHNFNMINQSYIDLQPDKVEPMNVIRVYVNNRFSYKELEYEFEKNIKKTGCTAHELAAMVMMDACMDAMMTGQYNTKSGEFNTFGKKIMKLRSDASEIVLASGLKTDAQIKNEDEKIKQKARE